MSSNNFGAPATAWIGLILCAAVALAFRLPGLERRPMHTDEAVQAAKTGALLEQGYYRYDPHEFHGPTLYYFTLPALWLSGTTSYAESTEFQYRIVPVVFGAGAILLLLLLLDALGNTAAISAGVLTAVSPACVYYSRYYIQETPLILFSLAAIACGWRWFQSGKLTWALPTGISIGLMHATKETCVISYAAIGTGLLANKFLWRGNSNDASLPIQISKKQIALALAAAAATSLLFFSSFFTNAHGPLDSILTYGNYLTRNAAEHAHDKPWDYYAKLLLWNRTPVATWTEGLIVFLAAIGAFSGAKSNQEKHAAFARFLNVYTLTMALAYSLIAYKTPWCVLGILQGLILLAGIGAAEIIRYFSNPILKACAILALCAGAAHLGWQAYMAAFKYPTERNPYAYEHTSPDALKLAERIVELSRIHPDGSKMQIQIMAPKSDYWPLPWYLRKMERVGFWNAPPAQLTAPIIVAAPEFDPEIRLELKRERQVNIFGLRPGVFLWLYVDEDLWGKFMATRK